MASKTSTLVTVSNPARFGYKIVGCVMGHAWTLRDQTVAVGRAEGRPQGDLLQDGSGNVFEFICRQDSRLVVEPIAL